MSLLCQTFHIIEKYVGNEGHCSTDNRARVRRPVKLALWCRRGLGREKAGRGHSDCGGTNQSVQGGIYLSGINGVYEGHSPLL